MEFLAAKQFLYETLTGDPAVQAQVGTRVFDRLAPLGTPFPYIVYQNQVANDVRTANGDPIFINALFLVKVITEGNTAGGASEATANAVYTALNKARGSNARGQALACVRESIVEYLENGPDGKQYLHLGQTFRIYAQQNY